ncbi:hypothetical protein F7725_025907 [Dissostichus mawsoni]|uniref:CTCK domain-containing protein n=1 Tax=Dissostichus mawsoni TaxID=36200 RepID=A0A7J5X5L0_DISMA|nr:hypothetical protein F7725_025907 [Dissostichus mawsoni]
MTCGWSEWINLGKPTSGPNGLPMSEMGQTVTCNKDVGFICNNKQQGPTQHNNYNTLNAFHHSNNYNTLNSLHHSNNYNTLNSFHHSNNYNTLNSFHHSNNYNTLNSFHHSNNYNTLNAFHHGNNYNTLNSFHHSNNYNTLNSFHHSNNNNNTLNSFHYSNNNKTIYSFHHSNNYNTLNAFHHSNNNKTIYSFHHSNNYNTLNAFHHSNNYNTLTSFHHSNNYNTLNSFHHSNNYNTLNSFHHSNNYNTLNYFYYSNNYNTLTPSTTVTTTTPSTPSTTISVNDRHVSSAYQNGDFRITTTGIDTVLVIPKIHAKITFSGLIFSIDLPYSKFGNNTWGQYNQKFIDTVNEFSEMTSVKMEGCFCPNGTHLLSSASDECVPTCECDVKQCSGVPSCPVGSTLHTTVGVCCSNYSCKNNPDVCVFNNLEYQGYEYQVSPAQCCGQCVQVGCVVALPNSTHTLKPGTLWSPAWNPCVKFECVKIANHFITVEAKTMCPPYDPAECIPGTETVAPDGCCHICIHIDQPCNVSSTTVIVESQGCHSKEVVNVTYSTEMRALQHTCSCCQEVATSERQIQLSCPDSTEISYSYTHIEACACLDTDCSVVRRGQISAPAASSRRRRR